MVLPERTAVELVMSVPLLGGSDERRRREELSLDPSVDETK